MIHRPDYSAYVRSEEFLAPLGLAAGTRLDFTLLGQGEYNVNYRFTHPLSGKTLVLRINTGSQMHLSDQIGYEFSALQLLEGSTRTPKPLFCDRGSRTLVMEWLPGRTLRYETDLPAAAAILADIHALSVPERHTLLVPEHPAAGIYEECLAMAAHYFSWERAESAAARLLETLIREIGQFPLHSVSAAKRCIVNTELNSGNFLINDTGLSYLVDWEKPLLSEPAQDLGHFLVPTTTFWKTDTILTPKEIADFVSLYRAAVKGRIDLADLNERLPLFFTVTCLRGVSWCAMALREYSEPGRELLNQDTFQKIRAYLQPDFLENLLHRYVLQNFLKGI